MARNIGVALFTLVFIAVPLGYVISGQPAKEQRVSDALCARVQEAWSERMGWSWQACEVVAPGGEPFGAVLVAQSIGPFDVGDCVSIIASMRQAAGAPIHVSARISNVDEFSRRSVSCSEVD